MAALAVASSVLLIACSENSKTDNTPAAEIKVGNAFIMASADEAEYTIEYSIAGGGTEQPKIASATADCEWIIIEEERESSILVGVMENDTVDSRSGSITLSYKGAPDVAVTVWQSESDKAHVDANMRFYIDIDKIEANGVLFTITPTTQSTYYYGVVDKRTYNQYGSEFVINGYIDYIKSSLAKDPSYSVDDFLAQGIEQTEFPHLWSLTDYYIIAFDLNAAYGYSGNVTLKEFTTGAANPSGNDFTITAEGAKITVKPKNSTMSYLFDVVDIEYWSIFPTTFYAAYDSLDRMTDSGRTKATPKTGTTTQDFTAELNSSAYNDFVAFAYGSNGTWSFDSPSITTNVTYFKFYYEPLSSTAHVAGISQSVLPEKFIGRTTKK